MSKKYSPYNPYHPYAIIQSMNRHWPLLLVILGLGILTYAFWEDLRYNLLIRSDSPLHQAQTGEESVSQIKTNLSKTTPLTAPTSLSKIIIPSVGINDVIQEAATFNDWKAGAWHRPNTGDPTRGNMVLAGHRFGFPGLTFAQVQSRSFYLLGKIKEGDIVLIDWQGLQYPYQVTQIFQVDQTQVEIEAPTIWPQLTMYTCNLRGEPAGRLVVLAKPLF